MPVTHPTPQYHQRYENSLFALLRESYGATQNAMLGEKKFFFRQKYFFHRRGTKYFLIYIYIYIYIIFFLIFFTKERNGLSLILFLLSG
ncbi:MAG: hypothetical protein [Cotesia congregata filamentous virus 2]